MVQLFEGTNVPPSASDLSSHDGTEHVRYVPCAPSEANYSVKQPGIPPTQGQDPVSGDVVYGDVQWHGTCIHNVQTPRWVQKRKRGDPDDPESDPHAYNEPRRARVIAINSKFSLVATGTHG